MRRSVQKKNGNIDGRTVNIQRFTAFLADSSAAAGEITMSTAPDAAASAAAYVPPKAVCAGYLICALRIFSLFLLSAILFSFISSPRFLLRNSVSR